MFVSLTLTLCLVSITLPIFDSPVLTLRPPPSLSLSVSFSLSLSPPLSLSLSLSLYLCLISHSVHIFPSNNCSSYQVLFKSFITLVSLPISQFLSFPFPLLSLYKRFTYFKTIPLSTRLFPFLSLSLSVYKLHF